MLLEGLEDLPGVELIKAEYKIQLLTVTFDEAVVKEEYIMAAVSKEGYDITVVEANH